MGITVKWTIFSPAPANRYNELKYVCKKQDTNQAQSLIDCPNYVHAPQQQQMMIDTMLININVIKTESN